MQPEPKRRRHDTAPEKDVTQLPQVGETRKQSAADGELGEQNAEQRDSEESATQKGANTPTLTRPTFAPPPLPTRARLSWRMGTAPPSETLRALSIRTAA